MNNYSIIKQGYLQKVTKFGTSKLNVQKFRERWFVLCRKHDKLCLEYFDKKEDVYSELPTNTFDLSQCHLVMRTVGSSTGISIYLGDRILHLKALSEPEANSWEAALTETIRRCNSRKSENIYDFGSSVNKSKTNCNKNGSIKKEPSLFVDLPPVKGGKEKLVREENIYVDSAYLLNDNSALAAMEFVESKLSEAGDTAGAEDLSKVKLTLASENKEVNELDDDVYDHLIGKMTELEDWVGVQSLRNQRLQSSHNVYYPNPDPPMFNFNDKPLEVESFHCARPNSQNFGTIRTVLRSTSTNSNSNLGELVVRPGVNSSESVSPTVGAMQNIKAQILNPGGIIVRLAPDLVKNGVAFVELESSVWVAGWDSKLTKLHNIFHIGDELMSVNNVLAKNLSTLQKAIDVTPLGQKCFMRLRRMPKAKAFVIRRDASGQDVGIVINDGTNKIFKVMIGSLADKHGLSTDHVDTLGRRHQWTLTEVNNRTLNLFYKNREVDMMLNAYGIDISFVVQPSNFISDLKKQLKRVKLYKLFVME